MLKKTHTHTRRKPTSCDDRNFSPDHRTSKDDKSSIAIAIRHAPLPPLVGLACLLFPSCRQLLCSPARIESSFRLSLARTAYRGGPRRSLRGYRTRTNSVFPLSDLDFSDEFGVPLPGCIRLDTAVDEKTGRIRQGSRHLLPGLGSPPVRGFVRPRGEYLSHTSNALLLYCLCVP